MRIRTLARLLGALVLTAIFFTLLAATYEVEVGADELTGQKPAVAAGDFSEMKLISDSKQGGAIIRFPHLSPQPPGTAATEAETRAILRAWDKTMNHDPQTGKRLPPAGMKYLVAFHPCCSTEYINAGMCCGRDYLVSYDPVEIPKPVPTGTNE